MNSKAPESREPSIPNPPNPWDESSLAIRRRIGEIDERTGEQVAALQKQFWILLVIVIVSFGALLCFSWSRLAQMRETFEEKYRAVESRIDLGLDIKQRDLDRFSQQARAIERKIERYSALEQQFNTLSGWSNSLMASLTMTNEALAKLIGEFNEAKQRLATAISDIASFNAADGPVARLDRQLASVSNHVNTLAGWSNSLVAGLMLTNEALATLIGEFNEAKQRLATATSDIGTFKAADGPVARLDRQLASVSSHVNTLASWSNSLVSGLVLTNEALATLIGEFNEAKQRLATATSDIGSFKAADGPVARLARELASVSNNVNTLAGWSNSLVAGLMLTNEALATLIGEVNEAKQRLATATSDIGNFKAADGPVARLDRQLASVINHVNTLAGWSNSLVAGLTMTNEVMAKWISEWRVAKERFASTTSDFASLRATNGPLIRLLEISAILSRSSNAISDLDQEAIKKHLLELRGWITNSTTFRAIPP